MSKKVDKLQIQNIVHNLAKLSALPDEIIERIPQAELDEINNEIERWNKFAFGIESKMIIAKTWHKLKSGVNANA